MKSEFEQLLDFYQNNPDVDIKQSPDDEHSFEDPRDPSKLISINVLLRAGIPDEKLTATTQKIQGLLDENNITGEALITEGSADCKAIQILAEQPLPKSLGIRSEFYDVPVGFTIVHNLDAFKQQPAPTRKARACTP